MKKSQRSVRVPGYRRLLKNEFTNVASEKCTKQAALTYILHDNVVSTRFPPNSSYRAQIEAIANAALPPIPIASISAELEQCGGLPRGKTFFGKAARHIDQIASNIDDMSWWIDEKGLVMDRREPQSNLCDFDRTAGRLMVERSQNGLLEKGGLEAVAKGLDEKKYSLLSVLQPFHRKKVAKHNQEHPAMALKTFEKAIKHHVGRRGVQRRLYVARDRYVKSQNRS